MYIQEIEQTHESTLKGKYSLITTNTDYKNHQWKQMKWLNTLILKVLQQRSTHQVKAVTI